MQMGVRPADNLGHTGIQIDAQVKIGIGQHPGGLIKDVGKAKIDRIAGNSIDAQVEIQIARSPREGRVSLPATGPIRSNQCRRQDRELDEVAFVERHERAEAARLGPALRNYVTVCEHFLDYSTGIRAHFPHR